MKPPKIHHYILFTDGSRTRLKAANKDGREITQAEAKEEAERIYKKTVKNIETW